MESFIQKDTYLTDRFSHEGNYTKRMQLEIYFTAATKAVAQGGQTLQT